MFKQIKTLGKILKVIKPVLTKHSFIILIDILVSIVSIGIDIVFPLLVINLVIYKKAVDAIIINIIVLVIIKFGMNIVQGFIKNSAEAERKIINYKIEYLISVKILSVEYELTEKQKFLDLKSGACFAVKNYKSIDNLIQCMSNILCQIVILVVSGGYLIFSYPVLLILMVVGVMSQMYLNCSLNKKLGVYFEKLFPINRRFEWLNSLKMNLGRQKDIRLFDMKDMILRKIAKYNLSTCKIFGNMNDLTYKSVIKVNLVNIIVLYLGYALNGLNTVKGSLGIGEFLMLNELLRQISSVFNTIGDNVTSSMQLISYLEPLLNILDYKPISLCDNKIKSIETIELKNVSFKYPDAKDFVLKNVSFSIKRGEKIGIIGLNGAGKTTVVKLICGFYKPTEGEIFINGVSMNDYDWRQYISRICPVFQDFKIFDFTIKENIVLNEEYSSANLEKTLKESDLFEKVNTLSNHEDTLLGPQSFKDGIQLSGGEQQKLAIARAMYRDGDMYIFDEPNASLDPMAEYNTYKQYNKMIKDSIAIFISHRMITTRFCTKILTVENGNITNFDTPENLLRQEDSLYCKLFSMQKEQLNV